MNSQSLPCSSSSSQESSPQTVKEKKKKINKIYIASENTIKDITIDISSEKIIEALHFSSIVISHTLQVYPV